MARVTQFLEGVVGGGQVRVIRRDVVHEREKAARDALGVEQRRIERRLADKLGETEGERTEAINEVLQKTYAEAIKRKAKRLGNITSVRESTDDNGEYSLTITIAE